MTNIIIEKVRKTRTIKIDYTTITKGLEMPIAYIENGTVKTIFRTIKQDEKGFYVSINAQKQYVEKSDTTFKGVSTIIVNGENAITKKSIKKVATKKAENEKAKSEKVSKKRVKSQKKRIQDNEQEKYSVPNMEIPNIDHLDFLTTKQKETIINVIDHKINGVSNVRNGKTYKIEGWNSLTGVHKQDKYFLFQEVTDNLVNAVEFQNVQVAMVMLLQDNIKMMAQKMLDMGSKYKSLEKQTTEQLETIMTYQNASSNSGKILFAEAQEIAMELFIQSSEKVFNENMFDSQDLLFWTIALRVSNALRTEIRRHAKFKANLSDDAILEVIDEKNKSYNPSQIENILELATTIVNFTEKETNILKLRLQGFTKKEIDTLTQQRNDRTYNSYMKKLQEKSGLTVKEIKKQMKEEHANEKARKKAMNEEIKRKKSMNKIQIATQEELEENVTILENVNVGDFIQHDKKVVSYDKNLAMPTNKETSRTDEIKSIERKLCILDVKIYKAEKAENIQLVNELTNEMNELYSQLKAM